MDREELLTHVGKCWPTESVLATTAQLANADCGDRHLTRAVHWRLIFRLRRGVYVQAHHWVSMKPWEQDKLRLLAHIVTVAGQGTYSHFSAARLHGLAVWNSGCHVHLISRKKASGVGSAKDVRTHGLPLDASEVVFLRFGNARPVKCTSIERTVVDCARFGSFESAVIVGDNALYQGADLELMRSMVDSLAGKRGARRARRVLAALDGQAESAGETRTRVFLASMDIPQPVLQYKLMANSKEYRADFAWPELKLILEFDGNDKYFKDHRTAQVLREERRRENLLIEQGWRFIRIEWNDLDCPSELSRRIYAAIAAARNGGS